MSTRALSRPDQWYLDRSCHLLLFVRLRYYLAPAFEKCPNEAKLHRWIAIELRRGFQEFWRDSTSVSCPTGVAYLMPHIFQCVNRYILFSTDPQAQLTVRRPSAGDRGACPMHGICTHDSITNSSAVNFNHRHPIWSIKQTNSLEHAFSRYRILPSPNRATHTVH